MRSNTPDRIMQSLILTFSDAFRIAKGMKEQ